MGEGNDGKFMMDQISSLPVLEMTDDEKNTMAVATSIPLLDQHIALVKEYTPWWLPTAGGILAVGLRFYDPLLEYFDLNSGLFKNVLESLSGEMSFQKPLSDTR